MSGCQCGRPMTGGNLCTTCGENLRRNLGRIADRWPELEAALTLSGGGGEKGKTKHSMVAVGTAGTMTIRDNGSTVQFIISCGDGAWACFLRSHAPSARYSRRLRVASSLGGWRRYRRRPCSLRRRASALR